VNHNDGLAEAELDPGRLSKLIREAGVEPATGFCDFPELLLVVGGRLIGFWHRLRVLLGASGFIGICLSAFAQNTLCSHPDFPLDVLAGMCSRCCWRILDTSFCNHHGKMAVASALLLRRP
jgi:hypothetical protein